MNQRLSIRLLPLGIALGALAAAVVLPTGGTASAARLRSSSGTLVGLRKTALGSVLVDARGHTLYLFEKDRGGVSACDTSCAAYWPALTSRGTPHAGAGVQQTLLGLGRGQSGRRQVTYAGHPLYTFVGDKQAGQTTGEGLTNFGAGWDALAANGEKVEPSVSASSGSGGSSYGGGY